MALIVDVSTLIQLEMKLLQGSSCANKVPLQLMVPPHLALVLLVLVALRPSSVDGRTRVLHYLVPPTAMRSEQQVVINASIDFRLQRLPLNAKLIILHDNKMLALMMITNQSFGSTQLWYTVQYIVKPQYVLSTYFRSVCS